MLKKLVSTTKRHGPKAVVFLLLAALLLTFIPAVPGSYAAFTGDKTIDEKTGQSDTLPALQDGQVWTGKSVDETLPNDKFGVTLSALGQNFKTASTESSLVNVALVLDASSSMNDSGKLGSMITAANSLISTILSTAGNKVGVVTFNDNATTLVPLTSTSFNLTTGDNSAPFNINTGSGTNVQSGMNAGYKVLDDAQNGGDTAAPILIVLTDGATWYYNTNCTTTPIPQSGWTSESNGYSGNGVSSNYGITTAAYTIKQAQYFKTQMSELSIYTIGFGTSGNVLTTTTLNPTKENIKLVTGATTSGLPATPLYGKLGFANEAAVDNSYLYTNGYFSSTDSLASLTAAFNQLLTTINNNNAPLAPSSTVTVTDTIGDDFMISSDLTMTLKSGTYTFTKSGSDYISSPVAPTGVSVTLSGTTLTWTFPASELLCNYYAPNSSTVTTILPTKLVFNVELASGAAAYTNYYTNYNETPGATAGANSTFTPVMSNPYYVYNAVYGTPVDGAVITKTNTPAGGSWGTPTTNVSNNGINFTTNGSYTAESLIVTSVTVTYNGRNYSFDSSDIDSISAGSGTGTERYFVITIDGNSSSVNISSQDYRLDPNSSFSFRYYPSRTSNKITTVTGQVIHERTNNSNGTAPFTPNVTNVTYSYTPESFSLTTVTVTNGGSFAFTAANSQVSVDAVSDTGGRHYPVTVSGTITNPNVSRATASFTFDYFTSGTAIPNKTGTFTVQPWTTVPADDQFQVTTLPTGNNTPAAVKLLPNGPTFSGGDTDYTDATHWTFTTQPTESGGTKTSYRVNLNGSVLTVTTVTESSTSGTWSSPAGDINASTGLVSHALPNTGMIRLRTALADLVIKKNVTAVGGVAIPQADVPANGFEFTLSTGSSGATSLFPYILKGVLYNAADQIINSDYQFTANGNFYLNAGEYIKVTLPVGTVYSVSETAAPGYVTMSQNAMGSVGAPMDPVVFTNTYYPTATINITKNIVTLYDSAAVEAGVTFNFALYYMNSNDEFVNIPVTLAPSITTADGGDADSLVDKTYTVPVSIRLATLELLKLFGNGDTATIYVHETAPANPGLGWVLDNEYYPVTITKTGTVTQPTAVTNKYQPTAQLTLTKTVDVGSADKPFHFDIEISAPADATYQYNYAVTVAGTPIDGSPFTGAGSKTISVDLQNSQSAVITGIPVGATYTVKEDNYSGDYYYSNWAVDANGRPTKTGSIAVGNNAVGITNRHETRDLTITKNVAGVEKNPGDSFDFVVKNNAGVTVDSFTLSPTNNYTKTLKALFVGETYTVTESGSTMSEYKTTVQKTVGSTAGTPADYNSTSGYIFALEKNDTTLLFTNTFKEGQLKVTKSVVGTEPASESPIVYGIQVKFAGSNLDQITCSSNGAAVSATSLGVFDLSLAKGGYADFSNIPEGVTYTVFESETGKKTADHVAYTYSDSNKKIMDGEQDTVTVTNTYDTPSKLTISKDIPDSGYDRTAGRFDFTISFFTLVTPAEGDGEPVKTPHTLLTNELPTINPSAAATAVNFSKVDETETVPVHYTFSLANDEQLIFTDLPVGVYYEIAETATQISSDPVVFSAGGARSSILNVNGLLQSGLTATGDIKNDAAPVNVTYANNFNIDTGSLTLSKIVTGDTMIAPASYDFTVVFTKQMDGITLGDNQGEKDEIAGTVTFKVTLSSANGNSVKFDGLKGGTQYTITELTAADSTEFNGADSTAEVDGKHTASGTIILPDNSWKVTDESVTCTNHYTPPATTTVKDAYKTTGDGLAAISAEGSDIHADAVAVGGVYVGDTVTYKITVTNSGPKTLRLDYIFDVMFGVIEKENVTVTGPDKQEITLFSLDAVSGGNALVLTAGVELDTTESVIVTYTTSYSDASPKTNIATSYATYSFNYNGTAGTKTVNSDDDAKINVYYHSDMTLVKDVAAGAPVVTRNDGININISGLSFGENAIVDYLDDVTYRLTLTNIKEASLSNVTITDYQLTSSNLVGVIKNGSVLAPSAYAINADAGNAADDHTLTLTGGLKQNDVIVILYTLKPIESHLNTAIAQAFDGLNTLEKRDTANVTVKMPAITVIKSATPLTVITGNSAVYTITIKNDYDRTLDLTSVQDNFFLPSSDYTVSNIRYKIGNGASADITPDSTGTIIFPSGTTFEPGLDNAVVITYTVTFATEKSYDNTANVTAAYMELPVYGTDTETVRVKDPSAILVTKLVNDKPEDTVLSGSTVTYTVTIQNNGKAPLGNLTLTDPLFDKATITGLTLTDGSTTTDLEYTPKPMTGTILTITPPAGLQLGESTTPPEPNTFFFSPGATIKLTYTAVMTATYTNTVLVKGLADTEDKVEDDATAKVNVSTPPVITESYGSLTVDKTISGDGASPTEKFAFTVTFTANPTNVLGISNSAGLTGNTGVYTFSLSANDTPVTFSNIPVGTTYTVSEAITAAQAADGWTGPASALIGTISAANSPVAIANTYASSGVAGTADKPNEGTDDEPNAGVAGDSDVLPQTGGLSSSTLLGLFGLALIAIGGTSVVMLRKKNHGKNK